MMRRTRSAIANENVNPQTQVAPAGRKRPSSSLTPSTQTSKIPKISISGNGSDEEQSFRPPSDTLQENKERGPRSAVEHGMQVVADAMKMKPPSLLSSPVSEPMPDFQISSLQLSDAFSKAVASGGFILGDQVAAQMRDAFTKSLLTHFPPPNPDYVSSVAEETDSSNASSLASTPASHLSNHHAKHTYRTNINAGTDGAFSEKERKFFKKEYLRSAFIDGTGPGLQDDSSNVAIAEQLTKACLRATREPNPVECMVKRKAEIEENLFPNRSALKQLISDIRFKLVQDVVAHLTNSRKHVKEFIKKAFKPAEGALPDIEDIGSYRFYDVHGSSWENAIWKAVCGTDLSKSLKMAFEANLNALDDPESLER
jgi:hypothetical protein